MDILWFNKNINVDMVNQRGKNTLAEHLEIIFTEIGPDYMLATMPVDHRTKQPNNILNGGASAALVETLASTAANCCLNNDLEYAVGLEINANHLKSTSSGIVTARTWPMHIGGSTHVWGVEITQDGKKICVARMTMLVRKRN